MGNERIRLTIVIVLLVSTVAGVHAATVHRASQVQRPDWNAIPYQLEGWKGADSRFDPVYGADPAESNLLRIYQRDAGSIVIAYVGFYSELTTVVEVHTPERCYPGQGWKILSSGSSNTEVFRGKPIPARHIVVEKDGMRRLVAWWYNAGSQPSATRLRNIYAMLVLSSITGRTDGSLVRLETPIIGADELPAARRVAEFERDFLPKLDGALPR